MKCPWTDPNDLQKYMQGVFRYDGKPIYIEYTGGKGPLRLIDLMTLERIKQIKADDPLLDIESPELGYMNNEKGQENTVYMVEREPHRQFSQGLTKVNTMVFDLTGRPVNLGYNLVFSYKGFTDMVVGNYPEFEEGMALLKNFKEIALSREVAVQGNPDRYPALVFFRGEKVGYIEPGTRIVKVPTNSKAWLVSKYLQKFTWEIV